MFSMGNQAADKGQLGAMQRQFVQLVWAAPLVAVSAPRVADVGELHTMSSCPFPETVEGGPLKIALDKSPFQFVVCSVSQHRPGHARHPVGQWRRP